MRFRGSNEHWGDEGAGSDTGAGQRASGPIHRLWSRLRPGRGPQADDEAEEGSAVRRPRDAMPPSHLAAPRPPATSDQQIRHVAQATGGPFVETRLAREVRRLIDSLGTTRSEVAMTLERHGVRAAPGRRGPVACFLEAVIGADPNVKSVAVDPQAVVVELRAWWRPAVVVTQPCVVRAFTIAFDAGCYPRLLPTGYPANAEAERGGE
jgi:hypothetical protein